MNRKRVLIIDDEVDMVKILTKGLEAHGYDVMTAPDGWGGFALARLEKPNLILLDNLMPKMDGATTLASPKAVKETRGIPVIVLTALSDIKHLTDAVRNGASAYIIKPCDPGLLLERIGAMLRPRRTTSADDLATPESEDKDSVTTLAERSVEVQGGGDKA